MYLAQTWVQVWLYPLDLLGMQHLLQNTSEVFLHRAAGANEPQAALPQAAEGAPAMHAEHSESTKSQAAPTAEAEHSDPTKSQAIPTAEADHSEPTSSEAAPTAKAERSEPTMSTAAPTAEAEHSDPTMSQAAAVAVKIERSKPTMSTAAPTAENDHSEPATSEATPTAEIEHSKLTTSEAAPTAENDHSELPKSEAAPSEPDTDPLSMLESSISNLKRFGGKPTAVTLKEERKKIAEQKRLGRLAKLDAGRWLASDYDIHRAAHKGREKGVAGCLGHVYAVDCAMLLDPKDALPLLEKTVPCLLRNTPKGACRKTRAVHILRR